MSWLNNQFNQLKGQLEQLAHDVMIDDDQEQRLSEPPDGSNRISGELDQLEILEQSQKKIDELLDVCKIKDSKIASLQKQINESTEKTASKNVDFEDSWCWEPDNDDDKNKSGTVGSSQMTTISLDTNANNQSQQQSLKLLQTKNAELSEKNSKLQNENIELNRNLDELDIQHNLAVQNILETKNNIQQKLNHLTHEHEMQIKINSELKNKIEQTEINSEKLKDKFEKLQVAYTVYVEENVVLKDKTKKIVENSKKSAEENLKLKEWLEDKDKQLLELIEKVENDFGAERIEENAVLKAKVQDLIEQLEQSKNVESKLIESVSDTRSGSSSSEKHSEDEFIVVEDELPHIPTPNWEKKYNDLNDEKEKLALLRNELEENIENLKSEIDQLKNENKDFRSKVVALESPKLDLLELQNIKNNNEKLQEQIDSTNCEFIEYQNEHESIQNELNLKIIQLEDKILELQDKNTVLLQEIEEKHSKIEQAAKSKLIDNDNFDKLRTEKQENEVQLEKTSNKFNEYEKDVKLMKQKLESKIADLENEVKILTNRNSPEFDDIPEVERLKSENDLYKSQIDEFKLKLDKSEVSASNIQSRFVKDNDELKKKIIELEGREHVQSQSEDLVDFSLIKNLFKIYTDINLREKNCDSLESAFKTIKDELWKVNLLEKNIKQMSDEIVKHNEERQGLQHDITTLNADIENYKIECNELMKNNEILLNELEKHNKLQPIPENNEENLIQLEKQLEECNNLNKSLEDQYKELNKKNKQLEDEKEENQAKVQSLQILNQSFEERIDELKEQLDRVELEKCNLIFEINEMKTDDKKSAVEAELMEHKQKISNLELQLEQVTQKQSESLGIVESQKTTLNEIRRDCDRLEKLCREKDLQLNAKQLEIRKYENEYEILQTKLIADSSTEDDKDNLIKLIEKLKQEKEKLEDDLKESIKQRDDLIAESDDTNQLKQTIEQLNYEKSEMIKTIQMKHNENLQYYTEIQRLGQLLQSFELEKNNLNLKLKENCENCFKYCQQLDENSKNIEKLKDQINFLKEKSDILTTNLLTEQTNQKLLQQEKSDLIEQNNNLTKDLDRLRQHLVELEDAHTNEQLEMQNLLEQTNAKMFEMDENFSKSNTAQTSANIRANQHAETLQAQYSLVTQQRDELVAKISAAEDRESKNQAALVNLQCALEQFQREKNRDVQFANARIRKELQNEKENHKKFELEIYALKEQLADANQGLLAASRLSDQLELSNDTILKLKNEIEMLQEKYHKLQTKLESNESSQADKIEKSLIKSLLIGYIVSNSQNDKNQVLRVITTVLDFSQNENDKIGLNKNQSGWFSSLVSSENHNKENLVEAFVNFLEKESQPRNDPATMPNLLNIVPDMATSSRERKISSASSSGTSGGIQSILMNENIIEQFPASRNSSSILKDILNS